MKEKEEKHEEEEEEEEWETGQGGARRGGIGEERCRREGGESRR